MNRTSERQRQRPAWAWLATAALMAGAMLGIVLAMSDVTAQPPQHEIGYSTFFGGNLSDKGAALALGPDGGHYLAGVTESTVFPTATLGLNGRLAPAHGVDAYVAKFAPGGETADYIFWFNAASASDVDESLGLAVGPDGAAYVTGHTRSADFCNLFGEAPGYDTAYNGNGDAFILKIKPDGSGLAYCTFLGASDWDQGLDLAVLDDGSAIVTGLTWSVDFPTGGDAYDSSHNGQRDIFLAHLDPAGTNLLYSTYLGGGGQEQAEALAPGDDGSVYLAGWTNSTDFPATASAFQEENQGGFDAFLVHLAPGEETLRYATYLGGGGDDRAYGLAPLDDGRAAVAGFTDGDDFPVTAVPQDDSYNGGTDLFLTTITPQSNVPPAYSTYLGGSGNDRAWDLVAGAAGYAYLVGESWSPDFPVTDGSTLNGAEDLILVRLPHDRAGLSYAAYLGGADWDQGLAMVLGENGRLHLTGQTRSPDYPTTPAAYDTTPNGGYDAFLTALYLPPPRRALYLPLVRSE